MMTAHRMKRPDQSPLQQCEETLSGIHMHVAARVFAHAVPHGVVTAREVLPDAPITGQFIGVNRGTRPYVLPNRALERLAAHVRNDASAHIPAALYQSDNRWLLRAPARGA